MADIKEINSLIHLLDDPDMEVYQHVEERLLTMGEEVIAPLELAWEQSFDALQQSRIEELVHKIQFNQVLLDLELWALSGSFDLLKGLIIVNKYQYQDSD